MGPKRGTSALSELDEALIVALRMKTLLPLDDVLYALQPMIPHLSRSNLHRCLVHCIQDAPQQHQFRANVTLLEVDKSLKVTPIDNGVRLVQVVLVKQPWLP